VLLATSDSTKKENMIAFMFVSYLNELYLQARLFARAPSLSPKL
jgi:hypothetical protein